MRRNLLSIMMIFALAALLPAVSHAANSPDQASGSVVSVSSSSLTLSTDNGQQQFTINPSTDKPDSLKAGDKVQVWFRTSGDEKIATRISESSMSSSSSSQSAQAESSSAGNTSRSAQSESQGMEQSEQSENARSSLPQTGSSLPLIGLVGLVALGAGAAVRFFVRA